MTSVNTVIPFNITSTGVSSGGYAITAGSLPIEYWLSIGTSSHPGNNIDIGSGNGAPYTYTITGLDPDTIYYIRSYIKCDAGEDAYGNEFCFKTLPNDTSVNSCLITTMTVLPGMTYILPPGAEIVGANLDHHLPVPLGTLESSCIDTSIIPLPG